MEFLKQNNITDFIPTRFRTQVVSGMNYTFNDENKSITICVWDQPWQGGVQSVNFA